MKNKKNNDNGKINEEKEFEIIAAQIKDGKCNYTFKILQGVQIGDRHDVDGNGIILPDLEDAFNRLNVHLAVVMDIFKHANIEIDSIAKMHNHTLTALFKVTDFKISGDTDNQSVVMKGTYYVTTGGHVGITTPKVELGKLSSYQFHAELKSAIDALKLEVEDYKNGKFVPIEEDDFVDPKQLTIAEHVSDADFNNAKV